MTVEVSEKVVDIFGSVGISLPFTDIECEQGLVRMACRFVVNMVKVARQIFSEFSIELLSEQMRCDGQLSVLGGWDQIV